MSTLRYGDRGMHVLELQERLLELRYDLTRADGDELGDETWRALALAGEDCGIDLPWAGPGSGAVEVPAELLERVWAKEPEVEPTVTPTCEGLVCAELRAARLYDLRAERVASAPKVRVRSGRPVVRDLSDVDTLCLHQTATEYSVSPAQLRAAGGDRALALATRALGIACHAAVFPGHAAHPPLVVAASPLAWHVNHGNGLNPKSLGAELAGRFEGVEGDARTLWCPKGRGTCEPTEVTDEMIAAWLEGLRWLIETARAEGCPLRYLAGHRQSSSTRRSDPGELIWEHVALPIAAEHDLEIRAAQVWGSGRPIPSAWMDGGFGPY